MVNKLLNRPIHIVRQDDGIHLLHDLHETPLATDVILTDFEPSHALDKPTLMVCVKKYERAEKDEKRIESNGKIITAANDNYDMPAKRSDESTIEGIC